MGSLKQKRGSISSMLKVKVSRRTLTIEAAWALSARRTKNWYSSGPVTLQARKRVISVEETHPRLWQLRSWSKRTTICGNCSLRWLKPNTNPESRSTVAKLIQLPQRKSPSLKTGAKDKGTGLSYKRIFCTLLRLMEHHIMQPKRHLPKIKGEVDKECQSRTHS